MINMTFHVTSRRACDVTMSDSNSLHRGGNATL